MKIVLIGATGTIGKAVAERLSVVHEVLRVGHRGGDLQVDLGSKASIQALFETVGQVDAVVSAGGEAGFGKFAELSDQDFEHALANKLMGQVNLVRIGRDYISDRGSFTLTAGVMAREPIPGVVAIAMANGALESFTRAAALELDRMLRLNTVSPTFVKETMALMSMDQPSAISASDTAKAYVAAVEGTMTGQVLNAADYV